MPERLVFFRAETGGDAVIRALEGAGASVHLIPAYRAVCPEDDAGPVRAMLARNEVDAVLLGSARAARHYLQRIGDAALAGRPAIAVISDQAARASRELGLGVQVVAKEASFAAMLDGLEAWFAAAGNVQQGGSDA
jgi:uroporphyrinogen-III synthase